MDSPAYERSRLSDVSYFYTRNTPQETSETGSGGDTRRSGYSGMDTARTEVSRLGTAGTSGGGGVGGVGAVSRTRKDLFSAVIKGSQIIQIEKRNNLFISQGASEEYI